MYGIKVPLCPDNNIALVWVMDSVTGQVLCFTSASEAALFGKAWRQFTIEEIPAELLNGKQNE